jgi:hypothetical protein
MWSGQAVAPGHGAEARGARYRYGVIILAV